MNQVAKAPFPYFGGKSRIAPEVWRRLGDTPNFVDTFMGSNALLLARPEWDWTAGNWIDEMRRTETMNDVDGVLCNFWRALQADPEAVAHHADWPVSECDLHSRHIWLVQRRESLTERLIADPGWYDARAAGWWVWGICCWIGGGWCSGEGPWTVKGGVLVRRGPEAHGGDGRGVNRSLVHLGDAGRGVQRRRVHLTNAGVRVNRQRPLITDDGVGVNQNSGGIYAWFRALSARLRQVRVCCGDWSRVCGPTPTIHQGMTAVFLDPPYGEGRAEGLYAEDSLDIAAQVREWAIEWGGHPLMRIALCGYDDVTMPDEWEMIRWKANGGYGRLGNGRGRENRHREVVWFSPGCIRPGESGPVQMALHLDQAQEETEQEEAEGE